jgi:hypothetical protein
MKVYLGEFSKQDLEKGLDKQAISKAIDDENNKRNNIKFIDSKLVKKAGQIVSMKVWLTDNY